MKRRLDDLGRLVIPKEYRDEIGLENGSEANIEMRDNEIIITNPIGMKSENEVIAMMNRLDHQNKNDLFVAGYYEALQWVLNKTELKVSNNK